MAVLNKVVIVTGASSGIGLATAKLLAEKGAKLTLVSRSKEKLEKLSREIPNSLAVPADMTKIAEIKNMIEQTIEHFGMRARKFAPTSYAELDRFVVLENRKYEPMTSQASTSWIF